MGVQWWGFIMFVWVALTIIAGFLESSLVTTTDSSDLGTIEQVIQLKVFRLTDFSLGGFDMQAPIPNGAFWGSIAALATWDYRFFSGDMNIVRWIVWVPLTGATMFIAITRIGPVVLESISTVRRLLPF